MKMILDLASVSGSRGFSDACPLKKTKPCQLRSIIENPVDLPTSPNGVDASSLCNIDDEVNVGVVVVVASSGHFNVSISHSDVFCVDTQIFGCCHDRELDGSLIAKSLIGPFANRTDFLDGSDTVIGDENLLRRRGERLMRFLSAYRPYLGNDGVTALIFDKVGDLAGCCLFQSVGTYRKGQYKSWLLSGR